MKKLCLILLTLFLVMGVGSNLSAENGDTPVESSIEKQEKSKDENKKSFVEEKSEEVADQDATVSLLAENIFSGDEIEKEVDRKNQFKEEFTKEEIKLAKSTVLLEENKSTSEINTFGSEQQFLYSSSSCTTMNLYNPETLGEHTYIDCLGYLMEYLGVNTLNSNYYDVRFQGTIHSIRKEDVQKFLGINNIKSFPYYVNDGGQIEHYIERNPELEDSYIYISRLGTAPSWMIPGVKYYSFSGIYFVDEIEKLGNYVQQNTAINDTIPYYDYYLYLPLRTKTAYSGRELSDAFDYFYTNSGYKNSYTVMKNTGNNFIETQDKYGVNALTVLSMGIHESAYGTSNFAVDRNNLFGVDAVDSNPGLAASFSSVSEGIIEQGNYLSWVYADADYLYGSNYYGANLGNKGSGMNVKYASDPFWGEKIASITAKIDQRLGVKDYQKYGLSIAKQGTSVYWENNGGDKAFHYKESTSLLTYMYPVVTFNKEVWTKVAMEPPYNSNKVVGSRYPEGGAYNFNYIGYIDKKNLLVVNSPKNGGEDPINNEEIIYYTNIDKTLYYADKKKDGKIVAKYIFYPGTKSDQMRWNHVQYEYIMDTNGNISYARKKENNSGKIQMIYTFYANAKYDSNRWNHVQYEYGTDTNGNISYARKRENISGKIQMIYTFYANAKYDSNRWNHVQYEYGTDTSGNISYARKRENVSGKIQMIYTFYANTKYDSNRWNHVQYEYGTDTSENISYARKKIDNSNKTQMIYTFYANTKYDGNRWNHVQYEYELDLSGNIEQAKRKEDMTQKVLIVYKFYPNTKYDSMRWNYVKETIVL